MLPLHYKEMCKDKCLRARNKMCGNTNTNNNNDIYINGTIIWALITIQSVAKWHECNNTL